MTNYKKLIAAHTAKNRDVNKVAKYFTLCNNEGMNLKAFNFITNKPVKRIWNTKAE